MGCPMMSYEIIKQVNTIMQFISLLKLRQTEKFADASFYNRSKKELSVFCRPTQKQYFFTRNMNSVKILNNVKKYALEKHLANQNSNSISGRD